MALTSRLHSQWTQKDGPRKNTRQSFKFCWTNDDNRYGMLQKENQTKLFSDEFLSEVQNKREAGRLKLQGEDTAARVQQLPGQLQRFARPM